MPALRIDYQRSMKPFPVAGVILLSLAGVVLFLTGEYHYRLTVQVSDWQASLGKSRLAAGRQAQANSKRRDMPEMMQEIRQANEVLRQVSLPWERLFQAVESSVSGDVALLGMEPDIEKRVVRISCEARNIAAMLNYIRQLEKQREFGRIYLQSHQIQEQQPEKPVRFSLVATWGIAP